MSEGDLVTVAFLLSKRALFLKCCFDVAFIDVNLTLYM